jgi:hypothetical protein
MESRSVERATGNFNGGIINTHQPEWVIAARPAAEPNRRPGVRSGLRQVHLRELHQFRFPAGLGDPGHAGPPVARDELDRGGDLRWIGERETIAVTRRHVSSGRMGVRTKPGHTALSVTLEPLASQPRASDRTRPMIACLVA